jgi:hypothetical protein
MQIRFCCRILAGDYAANFAKLTIGFCANRPRAEHPAHESRNNMNAKMPEWNIPKNLQELINADSPDGDGMWEDDSWDPILLTIMAGTSYDGRDIPLSWQIEFEPDDERLEIANKQIVALELEPDGYGWARLIEAAFAKDHPGLVDELHFGDTDASACVVWVESERTCKTLMEVAWSLIHVS